MTRGADFSSGEDGRAAAARIFSIVDDPLDDLDPLQRRWRNSVSFGRGHHFSYPARPDQGIFFKSENADGLSLDIFAKESVAFVGSSGSEKSTAEALVLRFYELTAGRLAIDLYNIQSLNITWLRTKIGYVGQVPVLFNGTISENILPGKPDATQDEVMKACKAANAHSCIMKLPNGYDSEVGTGGLTLSGGKKQRLAIARAIISDPAILVLDESASALDSDSERIVQAALDDLQEKSPRTTLVVAHRLMTVKNCEKITVLGGGCVQELGTHDSLLKKRGIYHQLWKLQGTTRATKV